MTHVDAAHRYLYSTVHSGNPVQGNRFRLLRYDLTVIDQQPPKGGHQPIGAFESSRPFRSVLSGSGEYLLILPEPPSPLEPRSIRRDGLYLQRVRADTMTVDLQMLVPHATGRMAASSDGSAVYVVANRNPVGVDRLEAELWEVGYEPFRVRRVIRSPGVGFDCVTSSNGGGIFVSWQTGPIYAVEPTLTNPLPRRLPMAHEDELLVGDGRRVVVFGQWTGATLWDVEGELRALRGRRLGRLPLGSRPDCPTLSPDGKYLILTSGNVYLLPGFGAPPTVDLAARWEP